MRAIAFFLFISIQAFAQSNWPIVHIDDKFSVRLPSNYAVQDTMDMLVYHAISNVSTVTVIKMGAHVGEIEDRNSLVSQYDATQRGMLKSLHSSALSDSTYEINGFLIRRFAARVVNNGFPTHMEVLLLSYEGIVYAFTFSYENYQREDAAKPLTYFFSSITPANGITPDGQTGGSAYVKIGESLGQIFVTTIGALTLLAIILLFFGRRRHVAVIKNTIAFIFLLVAIVTLLVFTGNLLFGMKHWSMGIIGVMLAVIGAGLILLRIPEKGNASAHLDK